MDDTLTRFVADLAGRLHGPLTMRLWLQPLMAMIHATRDGVNDAHKDRPAYFWALFTQGRNERRALLREGWRAELTVVGFAAAMDAVYQWIVLEWIYPIELVVVVLLLALVPYVLLRGPINRIARRWTGRKARTS